MSTPSFTAKKTAARLAAVQVLYSCDVMDDFGDPATQVAEFLAQHTGEKEWNYGEGRKGPSADEKWLLRIVKGACHSREEVDRLIESHLAETWSLARLDHVVRALLRVAVYELIGCKDVPLKVVINEYMSVTRTFFEGEELGFINGILDKIGKKVREE